MRYRHRVLGLLALTILAACQSARLTGVSERLDARAGITLVSVTKPLVFARTEGRYSRSARDYIYLGPVEVNRQGQRDYFLWVGVGTTLDRGYLAPESAIPDTLIMSVRGELMALDLLPWDQRVPGLADPVIYDPAVRVRAALGARVSRQQLALIANESLPSIRVAASDGTMRAYTRWRDGTSWDGLIAAAP